MASNSLKSSEGKQVAAIGLPSIDHGSMEYGLDLERAGLSGRPRRSSCTIWPSMLLVLEVDRPRNELLNEQSGFLVLSGYSASFFRFRLVSSRGRSLDQLGSHFCNPSAGAAGWVRRQNFSLRIKSGGAESEPRR